MPLEVKELTDESGLRRYDELVQKAAAGSVFATRSWHDYAGIQARYFGVLKGVEYIAGAAVPVSGGGVVPVVHGTPWTGIVARPADEGEHLQVACELAAHLRREFGACSLTLPPEWTDVRGFLWDGWRSHVRYTYRGWGGLYEKRLRLRKCAVMSVLQHRADEWFTRRYTTSDADMTAIFDWRHAYYWKANEGSSWHGECLDRMIVDARSMGHSFDLVGCNSPKRSLFKRAFGGKLTPYYFVTTGDPADIKEFWGERRPIAA